MFAELCLRLMKSTQAVVGEMTVFVDGGRSYAIVEIAADGFPFTAELCEMLHALNVDVAFGYGKLDKMMILRVPLWMA